jgi:NAD-specific glutamate dehydrogenase
MATQQRLGVVATSSYPAIDLVDQQFVEYFASQVRVGIGATNDGEPIALGPKQRCVKRAAAKVIDRHMLADFDHGGG